MAEKHSPSPSSDDREREIFLEALDQPSLETRAAYLQRACGEDRALRAAVEGLLAHHKADAFLETPVLQPTRAAAGPKGTAVLAGAIKPGDWIGRYKLLQEVGEGACGTVYMAEQEEPVRRRVALKMIKPGMDSRSVIARFEAERQALALMDHPNIARVFDAGTTETGRPYFVMELVRGIRITEYCDQNHLSTRERLDLFCRVCHAIQHAHQKGIIHRDIKPSNVLVTLHDGIPVPKVIDFGIAKAVDQRLTNKTVFTQFQAFIGTPAYTSPEQAEMSGLDIDTRSDIYSLGVLLYELLTGQTPFDPQHLLESGLDEMRRIIRQEEPLRPSTRLSTLGMAEATSLARTRNAKMLTLVQAVKGDLDWIVMKCLEKDRTRRYPTAHELVLDIQHYMENEPVLARPPSTAYRLQKFVRRNRVVVGASAIVAVVLLCALALSSWLAIRARQAEREQARFRRAAEAAGRNEAEQRQRAEREGLVALRRSYTSDMNLVQQALAANNYGRVIELLNRHRPPPGTAKAGSTSERTPDFRQWEWRHFWYQSRGEASFSLPQQPIAVVSVALSPNGRLLLTGDLNGTIKLWDLAARTQVDEVGKQGPGFPAFAFSRDGARVAIEVDQRRRSAVRIWTVATRQFTVELPQEGGVESLVFSPDDTKVLVLGRDGRIRTWDLQTQQLVSKIDGPTLQGRGPRFPAVFSPDAKWLAVRLSGGIGIVDVQTGAIKSTIAASGGDVSSLAFSPKDDILATGPLLTGTATDIKLFSPSTGMELGNLVGHVSWVPGLTFTPDGKRLISAGADQMIRIWDVGARREVASLRGHLSEVNCVTVTPDGKTVVSGCKDGTILGWSLENLAPKEPFETWPVQITSIEFFRNQQGALTVNDDGTVGLWNVDTLKEIEPIAALGTNVTRILLSPDESRLYAGTVQGSIQVLDWATRLVITNVAGPRSRRFGQGGPERAFRQSGPLAFVNKGQTLVVAGSGATIRLLDTTTWESQGEWRIAEGPPFFSAQPLLSPDEQSLLVSVTGAIEFRNVFSGETQATLAAQTSGVSGLAFSPDGTLLATSSTDGSVNLWDATQHKLLDVLRGHLLGVHAVTFSPDGERLATVSHGTEAVKLWDVATRHEVATLGGQGSLFRSAKFSPDGKLLVAINMQRRAYVWRAPSEQEIANWEAQSPNRAQMARDPISKIQGSK